MDGTQASEFQWPDITIQVSSDCLHALAAAVPFGTGEIGPIDRQYVVDRLVRGGVVFGLLEAGIERFIDTWRQYGSVPEPIEVAAGLAPQPREYGSPQLHAEMLTDPALIDVLRARPPSHYHDLVETAGCPTPVRVELGDSLVSVIEISPGRPGVGVDGSEVFPADSIAPLSTGAGAEYDPATRTARATRSGVALFDGRKVDVLAVNFDAQAQVTVTDDGLSAVLSLTPPGPGGVPLSTELVRASLASAGVKMGIVAGAVEGAVAQVDRTGRRLAGEIAQGRKAQDGYDAQLEHLVDMQVANVPLLERGGRVDFKGIRVICAVAAGQPLIRRHPGAKGVPGYTVTGKIIPAYNGREVRLPRGRNVAPDSVDADLLLARIDGHVRQAAGGLEVQECFSVGGDVDYCTGHITYERSVVVKGDVKSGFNMTVGGDLEVGGLVEDSIVKAGGNVLIRRGFVGTGQGLLEAKGDALIGFGRNQTVRCESCLTMEREAINMVIQCRNRVVVTGLLVGGRVSVRNRLTCRTLGNDGGTRTEVEVGLDYVLLEQRANLEEDIRKLRRMLYAGGALPRPALSSTTADRMAQERDLTPARLEALIESLEEHRRALLEQAYACDDACVVAQERVGQNVIVRIGNAPPLRTQEPLPGPVTFALRGGEVEWA